MNKRILTAVAAAVIPLATVAVIRAQSGVDENRVRAHMEFLASDQMQGRGSGTKYEQLAGLYIAAQMRQSGVAPAGDKTGGLDSFLQTVAIERTTLGKTTLAAGGESAEVMGIRVADRSFAGPLQRLSIDDTAEKGSIALVSLGGIQMRRDHFSKIFSSRAKAVIVVAPEPLMQRFSRGGGRGPSVTSLKGQKGPAYTSLFFVSEEAAAVFADMSDGAEATISSEGNSTETSYTWNAVGKIEGGRSNGEAILLSAHMDHVGVREGAPGDDKIFNGADDDASGCVAVLELARVLASGPRPRRTIYFAFFGSEEAGGFGSRYFVENLPVPMDKLVANLQFEMLGRPDEKVGKDELWLTGFERSDLGSELARNGARLVADPHPDENFFERSDNITLARKGIVAHTVSSFGLHKDYHRASDEIQTIDFPYMTRVIGSMVASIRWLANTDWKPSWKEGKKP